MINSTINLAETSFGNLDVQVRTNEVVFNIDTDDNENKVYLTYKETVELIELLKNSMIN